MPHTDLDSPIVFQTTTTRNVSYSVSENENNEFISDLISQHGAMFRQKILSHFQILSDSKRGRDKTNKSLPKISYSLTEKGSQFEFLTDNPHCSIKLQKYLMLQEDPEAPERAASTFNDRRVNRMRVKFSPNPPFDIWANWIVESAFFQNMILTLIIMNLVVLGIQAEIMDVPGNKIFILKIVMTLLDYLALFVFVLEICLKWCDNFGQFWTVGWNIFDFVVTFLGIIPELFGLMSLLTTSFKATDGFDYSVMHTSSISKYANYLKVFRIVRALKMVIHFNQMRLICLAVTKAFSALLFITVLLIIFAYIFAIMGIMFFDKFSHSDRHDLDFRLAFSSMDKALFTLWQVFTLDQWLKIYRDCGKVTTSWSNIWSFYIILWILLGSFVFKNIFAGVMVQNFQDIRKELFKTATQRLLQEKAEMEIKQLEGELHSAELNRQNEMERMNILNSSGIQNIEGQQQANISPLQGLHKDSAVEEDEDSTSFKQFQSTKEMNQILQDKIEKNINNLLLLDSNAYCWPKDTFFRYLQVMEALQESLKERQIIIDLLNQTILNMLDNSATFPFQLELQRLTAENNLKENEKNANKSTKVQ